MRSFLTSVMPISLVAAVGALPRVYHLGERAFWCNEAFFWRLSQFPVDEVVRRTGLDCNPPLYPLLLKGWSAVFGQSAVALRGLSALFGIATIVGVFLFSVEAFANKRESRRRATQIGLFAAVLTALSVFQIRWSWDVKVNALGAMLSVYSSWALFRAFRLNRLADWLLYGILALAFLYTHYFALYSVFVQVAFAAMIFLRRRRWRLKPLLTDAAPRRWGTVMLLLAIGWLPWLPTFLFQRDRDRTAGAHAGVSLERTLDAPFAMFCEPEGSHATDAKSLPVFLACQVSLLACLTLGTAGAAYTVAAAIVPVLLGILVSLIDTSAFEVRYLVFAHPFLLVAASAAVSTIPTRPCRAAMVGLLIAGFVFVDARFWRRADFAHRPGARGAAQLLDARRGGNEPVIISSLLYYYPLLYHSRNRASLWLFDDKNTVRLFYWGNSVIVPDELISEARIGRLTSPRVWIVEAIGGAGTLRARVPPGWIRKAEYRFAGSWESEGAYLVVEFENPESPR